VSPAPSSSPAQSSGRRGCCCFRYRSQRPERRSTTSPRLLESRHLSSFGVAYRRADGLGNQVSPRTLTRSLRARATSSIRNRSRSPRSYAREHDADLPTTSLPSWNATSTEAPTTADFWIWGEREARRHPGPGRFGGVDPWRVPRASAGRPRTRVMCERTSIVIIWSGGCRATPERASAPTPDRGPGGGGSGGTSARDG
jgi:hypothetical protein